VLEEPLKLAEVELWMAEHFVSLDGAEQEYREWGAGRIFV
jgi:hypothetical protein